MTLLNKIASWKDSCKTDDSKTHFYSGTEFSNYSVRIEFDTFGSFSGYSEEDAIYIFKKWYNEHHL